MSPLILFYRLNRANVSPDQAFEAYLDFYPRLELGTQNFATQPVSCSALVLQPNYPSSIAIFLHQSEPLSNAPTLSR